MSKFAEPSVLYWVHIVADRVGDDRDAWSGMAGDFFGLGLLGAEFIWARRLMDRMKREGERVREAVWPSEKSVAAEPGSESNKAE